MRLFLIVASVALCVDATGAAELSIPATNAQVITRSEGRSQVLLSMVRPEVLDHVSLGEVRLHLSREIVAAASEQRIQVLALRQAFAGGEPQIHEGLVSRILIERGASELVVDLSDLLRGVLDETEFHGFLITTSEGLDGGFNGADAQDICSALQGASLEISYRRVPPPPGRRGDRGLTAQGAESGEGLVRRP